LKVGLPSKGSYSFILWYFILFYLFVLPKFMVIHTLYLPTYLPICLFMSLLEYQVLIHLFWFHLFVLPKFVVIHTLCLLTYLFTSLLENQVLIHYAFPPNLSQVERSSSKPLTCGYLMDHFQLNVCIVDS
jgi:hypothetical protein